MIPVITRSASIDSSIVSDLDGSNIVYDDSEPIITISETKKKPKIPIKAIFTSVPFYAILIVHCCQNWGFYTLLTEMPTYLSQILHFDIKTVNSTIIFFLFSTRYRKLRVLTKNYVLSCRKFGAKIIFVIFQHLYETSAKKLQIIFSSKKVSVERIFLHLCS